MDDVCQRLEALSSELSRSISSINYLKGSGGLQGRDVPTSISDGLRQATRTLQAVPAHVGDVQMPRNNTYGEVTTSAGNHSDDRNHVDNTIAHYSTSRRLDVVGEENVDDSTESDDEHLDLSHELSSFDDSASKFGSLVADSYGKLRYDASSFPPKSRPLR